MFLPLSLSESQLSSLGELVTQGDTRSYLAIPKVLQDFLTDQLTEDRWDEGASLKEYLTLYTNGFSEEEEEWWFTDLFPDEILNFAHHAFEVYQWLLRHLKLIKEE